MKTTLKKDYFLSINDNDVIIIKNAEGNPKTFEELNDSKLRFKYNIDDKIVTPFGIETIKDINYEYGSLDGKHGYEWLITVKENKNQYIPIEILGIFVNKFDLDIFLKLTK